ncbi:uncharacterized protein LOC134461570 [Engraulis encrasicolus]|uniref:uncharacterized protein LOC134461570 n=1 Tax=Engraulis encrasicolus TaxID=184585 RepID=UPI002FD66730
MGTEHSQPQSQSDEEVIAEFFGFFPENYMNVGIDESLLMFSGTNSTAQLVGYSSKLQEQLIDQLPAFVEKVGGVLQGFTPVPNAVGLGAFVISTILQIAFIAIKGSSGSSGPSPIDMLRQVFAEEKSSKVRDLMQEYLKRYKMYLYDDFHLLEETVRLEKDLSLQITELQNSMLVDKQMSSRAVKHWVNGAAFHAQMLIHIARLKQGTAGFESAKRASSNAVDDYPRHMTEILERYKKYKLSTLTVNFEASCVSYQSGYGPGFTNCLTFCQFEVTEMRYIRTVDHKYCRPSLSSDSYLKYFFSNDKKLTEIQMYFKNLQNNLDYLANQRGKFVFEKKNLN